MDAYVCVCVHVCDCGCAVAVIIHHHLSFILKLQAFPALFCLLVEGEVKV